MTETDRTPAHRAHRHNDRCQKDPARYTYNCPVEAPEGPAGGEIERGVAADHYADAHGRTHRLSVDCATRHRETRTDLLGNRERAFAGHVEQQGAELLAA